MILPTLKQLRYLVALARERHFGRAAESCFVTQSTLSAGIQELENLLGLTLVDRTTRSVLFTAVGEDLVSRAQRVLRAAEDFAGAAEASKEPLSSAVRMGVIPTVAPFLLPRVLPELRRLHPGLKLYLKEDLTGRLVDDLHAGRLDLLLLALPCDAGDVETVVLFEDPFLLACRREAPLAAAETISSETLSRTPLLLLEDGHCLRDHALDACRLSEPRQQAFAATSLHTLVQMVDNDLGVTLLPALAVEGGILQGTDLVVRPIADDAPARQIGMAWRRGAGRRRDFLLLTEAFHRCIESLQGVEVPTQPPQLPPPESHLPELRDRPQALPMK